MRGRLVTMSVLAWAVVAVGGFPPPPPAVAQMVSSLQAPATQAQIDQLMMSTAQGAELTLDASGSYTWTFPTAFTGKPRVAYFPQNSDVSGKPIVCNYQALSATSITFHCDKGTGKVVNLLQDIFSTSGAAGATVMVIARGTLVAPVMP